MKAKKRLPYKMPASFPVTGVQPGLSRAAIVLDPSSAQLTKDQVMQEVKSLMAALDDARRRLLACDASARIVLAALDKQAPSTAQSVDVSSISVGTQITMKPDSVALLMERNGRWERFGVKHGAVLDSACMPPGFPKGGRLELANWETGAVSLRSAGMRMRAQ